MKYLVDTDWVIQYTHRIEHVVRKLDELLPEGIGISIVSLAELYEGVFNSINSPKEEIELMEFLGKVEVITLDLEICRIFGRERGRLRSAGNRIGDLDLLIGSTAIRHNLTLLTNNRRHFERIQGLNIISV